MPEFSIHKLLVVVACLLLIDITSAQEDPFVDCKMGRVVGKRELVKDRWVHSFLGVPYAEPPLGPLRFRLTEPIYRRIPITYAHKSRACIQHTNIGFDWFDKEPEKDEDCLYLNIWVPERPTSQVTKAVLFYIHGGGFYLGSNRLYNGQVLSVVGDIIVVVPNYRLGAFGFLYSGTEEAPGNMGLYDIIEALNWVQKNIEFFGGDPNRITIAGHDSGAIMATMLETSPLAEGLYHRLIIQSGSSLNRLMDDNEEMFGLSEKLAEIMYCRDGKENIGQNPEILECLREQDADRLSTDAYNLRPASIMNFKPRWGDEIIPENPRKAILSGNTRSSDVLIGINSDLGSYLLTVGYPAMFGPYGYRRRNIDMELALKLLGDLFGDFPDMEGLVNHYLRDVDETDYESIRRQTYTAMGDYISGCPTAYYAELLSRRGKNVYFYYFSHKSSVTPWAPWMGAAQGDDAGFVFGAPYQSFGYSEEEAYLSMRMMDDWGSFAKYGRPRRFWQRYTYAEPHLVVLNVTGDYFAKGPHRPNCDYFKTYFEI